MLNELKEVVCASDEEVQALVKDGMYQSAMVLYASMKNELVKEFMPRTGMDEAGTAQEIEKSIAHNPWGFIFRIESRKYVVKMEAKKTQEASQAQQAQPSVAASDFVLPEKGYCTMEAGCESCQ